MRRSVWSAGMIALPPGKTASSPPCSFIHVGPPSKLGVPPAWCGIDVPTFPAVEADAAGVVLAPAEEAEEEPVVRLVVVPAAAVLTRPSSEMILFAPVVASRVMDFHEAFEADSILE